jgi:hypothetical protein
MASNVTINKRRIGENVLESGYVYFKIPKHFLPEGLSKITKVLCHDIRSRG